MTPSASRLLLRLLAAAAALSLGLGAAACGSDDDDDANGDGTPTAQQEENGDNGEPGRNGGGGGARGGGGSDDGPALSGNRREARAGKESVDGVYGGLRRAVEAGIADTDVPVGNTLEAAEGNDALASLCDLMSRRAQRQTIVYARRSAGLADVDWTCEKSVGLLLRRSQQTGGLRRSLRAEVVGVNAEGDRATASIRFGGRGAISSVPLVKEDGEWKLGTAPAGGGGQ